VALLRLKSTHQPINSICVFIEAEMRQRQQQNEAKEQKEQPG